MSACELTAESLSDNDMRVVLGVRDALCEWDAYAPHGARDWTAIRRLETMGVVESTGFGVCQDCDNERHQKDPTEVEGFKFTEGFLKSKLADYLGIPEHLEEE